MDHIDRIVKNKISAKEIMDSFQELKIPNEGAETILEETAIPLLTGVAAIGVATLLQQENEMERALLFASALSNAFTAGMIAGMTRVENVSPECKIYDFTIK